MKKVLPLYCIENIKYRNRVTPFKDHPGFFKKVKVYFHEFCDSTGIHGFKFLGEKKRTTMERVSWLIGMILSFCGCTILIADNYQKWMSSPVIVSFDSSETLIGDVPFPSITICSDIIARRDLFNYSYVKEKITSQSYVTPEELSGFNYMNMICESAATLENSATKFANVNDALDFISKVVPPMQATIKQISWKGNIYDHPEYHLTRTLTSDGVCYTFNILDRTDIFRDDVVLYQDFFANGNASNWAIETGYSLKNNTKKRYPKNSVVSGLDGGIEFTLFASEADIDYSCTTNFVGFKVSLLHPGEVPKGRKNFISVPLDEIVLISAEPKMMRTSELLRTYSPRKRNCYFNSEKQLKFYKEYSQWNCLLECLTNATLINCGCVFYHMPRDNATLLCGSGSRKCFEITKSSYLKHSLEQLDNSEDTHQTFAENCDCLPPCTSLSFDTGVSQYDWKWQKLYTTATAEAHYSKFRVVWNNMQFTGSTRNELYGTTTFLACCGGLLGLFMGFSMLSMFEIVYFLTLRIFCNIRKYGRRNWPGTELMEVKTTK